MEGLLYRTADGTGKALPAGMPELMLHGVQTAASS